eukprot:9295097-Pyramimonas_sp.AAC.1
MRAVAMSARGVPLVPVSINQLGGGEGADHTHTLCKVRRWRSSRASYIIPDMPTTPPPCCRVHHRPLSRRFADTRDAIQTAFG